MFHALQELTAKQHEQERAGSFLLPGVGLRAVGQYPCRVCSPPELFLSNRKGRLNQQCRCVSIRIQGCSLCSNHQGKPAVRVCICGNQYVHGYCNAFSLLCAFTKQGAATVTMPSISMLSIMSSAAHLHTMKTTHAALRPCQ